MIRTLSAESLKYKRTSTLILAVGVPALIVLLGLAVTFTTLSGDGEMRPSEAMHAIMAAVWASMVLPMGIAILAGQAVGLEDTHLKQVLVQPVSRLHVFLTKFLAVLGLVALGSVVLMLGAALVGLTRGIFDFGKWTQFVQVLMLMLLGALPLIALGVGLSFRFKWPVTLGSALLGTSVTGLALQHPTAWKFLPWSYPLALAQSGTPQSQAVIPLVVAALAVILTLGYLAFSRQEPR